MPNAYPWQYWVSNATAPTLCSNTASSVWPTWVYNQPLTAAATTTGTWQGWVTNGATSNTLTTGTAPALVWTRWIDANGQQSTVWQPYVVQPLQPPTPEQVAEWRRQDEERQAAWERQRQEREKRRKAEARRARRLLLQHLNKEQRQTYERDRRFEIVTRSGRRYRIDHGSSGNVYELDGEGRAIRRYCIHPRDAVPHEDAMLAQKLMLETDEASFERIANITRLADYRQERVA